MSTKRYEDNGDKILEVDTKSIEPIVCDNFVFPMHSKYVFELKKVYTEEPTRQINGQINYFPPKFFVPYFTIGWNVVSVEQFTNIMRYVAKDELVVEYYDTVSGTYKKDKFYAQQPTYSSIIAKEGEYDLIQGLEVVFAGTLAGREEITIKFDANGGALKDEKKPMPNESGINGEEIIIPSGASYYNAPTGKSFLGWNIDKDSSNVLYVVGQKIALSTNMTLYAVWG